MQLSLPVLVVDAQIIRFGSNVSPVFPEAPVVPANDAHLARATEVLEKLEADLGGTELDQPLRIALAPAPLGAAMLHLQPRRSAAPSAAAAAAAVSTAPPAALVVPRLMGASSRSVMLFTDGEVSNTRDLIALARDASGKTGTRIHCFGIGNGVSSELVQVRRGV